MKSNWRRMMAWSCCLGILSVMSLGCVVHDHGHYDQVDVVDVQGFHHQGYYDEQHAWHGGYYDDNHQFHNDGPDWHR